MDILTWIHGYIAQSGLRWCRISENGAHDAKTSGTGRIRHELSVVDREDRNVQPPPSLSRARPFA